MHPVKNKIPADVNYLTASGKSYQQDIYFLTK